MTIPYPHEFSMLRSWRHWKQINTPPRIHLLVERPRLVQLRMTMGWKWMKVVLGNPSETPSSYWALIGYPSTLWSWCWLTSRPICARIPWLTTRLINIDPGIENCSGRVFMLVICPERGILVLDVGSYHVSGTIYLCEKDNSWKFIQYFVHETQICKKSWLSLNFSFMTWNFFWFLDQSGCSRPSVGFSRIINQYDIWIRFREKMVDWG